MHAFVLYEYNGVTYSSRSTDEQILKYIPSNNKQSASHFDTARSTLNRFNITHSEESICNSLRSQNNIFDYIDRGIMRTLLAQFIHPYKELSNHSSMSCISFCVAYIGVKIQYGVWELQRNCCCVRTEEF